MLTSGVWNMIDCYVYWFASLLILFINSRAFGLISRLVPGAFPVDYLGFSTKTYMLSVNRDSFFFNFFFHVLFAFCFFFFLLHGLVLHAVLNRSSENGRLCLAPAARTAFSLSLSSTMLPIDFTENFCQKWKLCFIKWFFCLCQSDHLSFLL